jgi:curved DNA-binding protein CbpA
MPHKTLYDILEVPQTATQEEIKFAYRRLAMRWHPDRNPGNSGEAQRRFQEINNAYKILSDSAKRAEYDKAVFGWQDDTFGQSADPGMSDSEADEIFFEQMLDLAFELASRGYDPSMILKMLLALDCPEGIAKSVVRIATKRNYNPGKREQSPGQPEQHAARPVSLESSQWSEVEPYFIAVIGGHGSDVRMNDNAYKSALRSDRNSLFTGIILLIVSVICLAFLPIDSAGLGMIGIIGLLIIFILYRISIHNSSFTREKSIRYYSFIFERFHNLNATINFNFSAFLLSELWIAYRRMPFVAILVYGSIYFIVSVFSDEASELAIFCFWFHYLLIGLLGNKLYFYCVSQKIKKVLHLPREQALRHLRKEGGTSILSPILMILFIILLSILLG